MLLWRWKVVSECYGLLLRRRDCERGRDLWAWHVYNISVLTFAVKGRVSKKWMRMSAGQRHIITQGKPSDRARHDPEAGLKVHSD